MRVSTKYAPRKAVDGQSLSCSTETTLNAEQLLDLYRYLKLTRLVEERLVNLYRQTKVVGGVFRSLGQEATAVGTAYALQPHDFITPLIRDLGAVLVKGIRPREIFAQYMANGDIVRNEDVIASERQQRGLSSRFNGRGCFTPQEKLVHDYNLWILDRVVGNASP